MERKIKKQIETLHKTLCELRASMQHRNGKPWTQQDVADLLGIRYQSYQAYERGVSTPSLENLLKLAEIYDVSLDYLVGKKEY